MRSAIPTAGGLRAAACVLLVSTLSACGGNSNMPTPPTPFISGQWQGTIESPTDGPGTVALQLTQTGANVAGSVLLSQNGIAAVPGTLTGTLMTASSSTTMQYTVTYEFGEHCMGTFSGTFAVTSRDLVGPYTGRNCVHEFAGAFHATKSD